MNRNTGRDPDVCSVRGSAGRWSRGKVGRKLRFTRTLGVLSCCVPRGPRDAPLYGTAAREGEPSRVAALGQPHFPQTEVGREDLAKPWSDRSHSRRPHIFPKRRIRRPDGKMATLCRHEVATQNHRIGTLATSQKERSLGIWAPEITRGARTAAILRTSAQKYRCAARDPIDLRESLGTGTEVRSQRWRRV